MTEAQAELTGRMLDADFWMRVRCRHDGCFAPLAKLAAEHPDVFAFESGLQIAKRCQTSQTTVVRFAHHLGFEGFSQMKRAFRLALRSRIRAIN
ncbi:MurR/RpiR family transcriptional regulator [Rhizobium rhizogenes]|uniref:MurR/RpiR family transcriptional regulator n=1 Tax=Rhizobium rhizogenes TaxID=359 RepID=UPI00226DC3FA|nr:hypothetical protein [Rhizobium rhizogenes]